MKNKVLVCGGAGYIGGLTCDYLIRDGFDVTVYDNLLYEERFLKEINFVYGAHFFMCYRVSYFQLIFAVRM